MDTLTENGGHSHTKHERQSVPLPKRQRGQKDNPEGGSQNPSLFLILKHGLCMSGQMKGTRSEAQVTLPVTVVPALTDVNSPFLRSYFCVGHHTHP